VYWCNYSHQGGIDDFGEVAWVAEAITVSTETFFTDISILEDEATVETSDIIAQ
jgi:hypothetical protein